MKAYFYFALTTVILMACNAKNDDLVVDEFPRNEAFQKVEWERGELTEMVVFGEKNDTTLATIIYSFAKDDSPLKRITDSLTCSFMTELKHPIKVDRKFFENEAKRFVNDFNDYASEDPAYLFPWYLNLAVDYCELDSNYVKGEFEMESYSGGAHGSHYVAYRMIDTRKNKVVQLSDLFSNRKELDKRVEAAFRKEYEIDTKANLKEEGYWFEEGIFTVNENFYFDENDIVFYFNPYEIGPYAMGAFTVHVPLSSLSDLKR